MQIEKVLLNTNNFVSSEIIDGKILDKPGFYCIRILNLDSLPESYSRRARSNDTDCLYLGLASKSLKKRFLKNEMRGKGHGTFFRSIGAILGFLPEKGSLIGKGSSRNYKFNKSDSTRIIEWLNTNTAVNWVVYEEGDYTNIEAKLIQSARPLLNIAKNEYALPELKDLRAKCVKIAKQQY